MNEPSTSWDRGGGRGSKMWCGSGCGADRVWGQQAQSAVEEKVCGNCSFLLLMLLFEVAIILLCLCVILFEVAIILLCSCVIMFQVPIIFLCFCVILFQVKSCNPKNCETGQKHWEWKGFKLKASTQRSCLPLCYFLHGDEAARDGGVQGLLTVGQQSQTRVSRNVGLWVAVK